ncbi:MAG: hypothetical protein ABIP94_25150 [Planctomycetota bacterium]
MKTLPLVLFTLLLGTVAPAQVGLALGPSGQPALAAIRPTLQNTVPAAVVQAAGNPMLRVHSAVITPAVQVGSPMFLLLGFPTTAPLPLGAPLLFPGFGLPGFLAMPEVVVIANAGLAGTMGNPAYPLPLPPGLGPLGLAVSAQILVLAPPGLGLTGATGIVI